MCQVSVGPNPNGSRIQQGFSVAHTVLVWAQLPAPPGLQLRTLTTSELLDSVPVESTSPAAPSQRNDLHRTAGETDPAGKILRKTVGNK